jgi:tetratricopeptide (TPR) repeat protein
MLYKGEKVNFTTVLSYLNDQDRLEHRDDFFAFLKQNKKAIDDDAVLGVFFFLEQNNWNIELLKNKRFELNTTFKSLNNKNRFTPLSLLKYAAAVFFVIGISIYIFKISHYTNKIYEPIDTGIPHFLSNKHDIEKWRFFMDAYKDDNYNEALQELYALMKLGVNSDTTYYYTAIVAYKLAKYDTAINMFTLVLKEEKNTFKYDSEYYLALSYYKNKDYDNAIQLLESLIKDKKHPFEKESNVLLKLVHKEYKQ